MEKEQKSDRTKLWSDTHCDIDIEMFVTKHRGIGIEKNGIEYVMILHDWWLLADKDHRQRSTPTEKQLAECGYSPGDYTFRCIDCGGLAQDNGDKRSFRCRDHALIYFGRLSNEKPDT